MPATGQTPFTQRIEVTVPAVGTAGNDQEIPAGVVQLAAGRAAGAAGSGATGVVTAVRYVPNANYTGAATNYRSFQVRNKGAAGAGTTVVAQLDGVNGTNLTAFDEAAITLSGTAANLVVNDGDVLSSYSLHVGTGLADPGGKLIIEFGRD